MSEPLAMSAPAADPWELLRQWGTPTVIIAVVGWLGRSLLAWRKRVRVSSERRRLEAKALRYLLDAQRHILFFVVPADRHRLIDVDELARQKALIDSVRDELWVADGHESHRSVEEAAEEVVKILSRTQAIQAKQLADNEARAAGQPAMFKNGGGQATT